MDRRKMYEQLSDASVVPILVCILPLVLVLWESAPLVLVLQIGLVLITATPAVPVFCHIRTSKFAFGGNWAAWQRNQVRLW